MLTVKVGNSSGSLVYVSSFLVSEALQSNEIGGNEWQHFFSAIGR